MGRWAQMGTDGYRASSRDEMEGNGKPLRQAVSLPLMPYPTPSHPRDYDPPPPLTTWPPP